MHHYITGNMIACLQEAAKYSAHPSACTHSYEGSTLYFSGSDFALFNGTFNESLSEEKFETALEKTCAFFAPYNKPFTWWWTKNTKMPEAIKSALESKQFTALGTFLGIGSQITEMNKVDIPNAVTVSKVDTENEYETFIAILSEVFELTSIADQFKAMFRSPLFQHYLGYYEGESVGAVTSYINNNVVGLYNGATLERARKHGVCSALLQTAVNDAKQKDTKFVVAQLMTEAMAQGITEKMGLRAHCELYPFIFTK